MLPNFIIIGTMKGGTTALYYYMASHPDIEPSSIKETNYFSKNYDNGLDWYSSLFKTDRKYAFEASPSYTKRNRFPDTPGRIHSLLPDIKLIYLLRDPIDRIVSEYSHNYAQGRESRPFSEAVLNTNRRKKYIQTSSYYFQAEGYMEYFDRSQLLLVESEQLQENPQKVLVEISDFLGISPEFDIRTTEKRFHESSEKTRATLFERKLLKKFKKNSNLRRRLKAIARPFRRPFPPPCLSDDDKEALKDILSSDVEQLRQFSQMKFSSWSL